MEAQIVNGDLRAPGMCFICEATRVGDDAFMVDTGVRNETQMPTPRTGEIYICDMCIDTLAKKVGYVKADDAEKVSADVQARLDRSLARLNRVREALDS